MPVSRSKRPLASTASCACDPISVQHRLDPALVLVDRGAADLHLHDVVAAVEVAAHLGPQRRVVLARVVVAAGGVDEDPAGSPRARAARRAAGTAACPRSWRPHPRPPCRACRPRPSARRGRPASRSSSSSPRPCADRGCRRVVVEQALGIGLEDRGRGSARGSGRPGRSGRWS